MLTLVESIPHHGDYYATLTLAFELRQKSRLRARLDNAEEVAVKLPRGAVLRGGDYLRAATGEVVKVLAAAEPVSYVACDNAKDFARASYHLGNRHVALEIGDHGLRYLRDHVLDEMVKQMGLSCVHESMPFEPEAGAYGGHHHGHSHTQEAHEENHAHSHSTSP